MGAGLMNPVHLAFIAVFALIFLGPKKLPELARSLGSGMREFRDSLQTEGGHDDIEPMAHLTAEEDHPAATQAAAAPAVPVAPVAAPAGEPAAAPTGSGPEATATLVADDHRAAVSAPASPASPASS